MNEKPTDPETLREEIDADNRAELKELTAQVESLREQLDEAAEALNRVDAALCNIDADSDSPISIARRRAAAVLAKLKGGAV